MLISVKKQLFFISKLPKVLKKTAFQNWIKYTIPFASQSRFELINFDKGICSIRMPLIKKNQNHIKTQHAIAIAQLGELTAGLSMISTLPENTLILLKELNVKYIKKGDTDLHSIVKLEFDNFSKKGDISTESEIKSISDELIAVVNCLWYYKQT
ncbi:DUF4442 domain-containing protein [bacterium]|nr:DUF4442 domain-containing protein [bacterium]